MQEVKVAKKGMELMPVGLRRRRRQLRRKRSEQWLSLLHYFLRSLREFDVLCILLVVEQQDA